MAYQPPLIVPRRRMRPAARPLVALVTAYVGIAICYSIGYGQAMSLMASASEDTELLLARQDYSRISGMSGPLSPFIQLGVLDAVRFQPKSLLFGVFSGLWASSDQVLIAQQNAGIVHPAPPKTGLSEDDVREMAQQALETANPGDPTKPIRPGSMSKDELMRRARAYAAQHGQSLPAASSVSREEMRKRLQEYGITVTR
jgi:hypothetical protein